MKLWNEKDVKDAMEKDEFIQYQEKRKKRQVAAEERRKQKNDLYDAVQQSLDRIVVEVISFDKLKNRVLWYNHVYDEVDEITLRRWMVNYVKYKMTYYDSELIEIAEKAKNYEAYILLHRTILLKIAEAYPKLKEECIRQIDNLLSKRNKRKMLEDNRKEKIFFEMIPKRFSSYM